MSVGYTNDSMYNTLIPPTHPPPIQKDYNLIPLSIDLQQNNQTTIDTNNYFKIQLIKKKIQDYIQEINMILKKNISIIEYIDSRKEVYKRDYFIFDSYVNKQIEQIITTDKLIHLKWDNLIDKVYKIKHCTQITPYININNIQKELKLILYSRDIYGALLKQIVRFIIMEDNNI